MLRLALTGGIACGKTTAANALRALGAPVLDADAISHALTAPQGEALPAIRQRFGDDVFAADGTLDRRALGRRVFADPQERRALEAILHPMVRRIFDEQLAALAAQDTPVAVLDIPLLYESGMASMADCVWVLFVPENVQVARVMLRDNLSEEEARQRIASQMPLAEKARRADVVIDTSGTLEETAARLRRQWEKALARGKDCVCPK